ncbi:MAG: DUF1385 domain-containing protein [Ruminococcus sp.]|jgi:uncharacterized protein YqhQ|nr:DUF1385 domain-containing protein [Ruminococcus sp.]
MASKTKKITSIGGSALIEGIMMRGPKKNTVCVRTGKDELYTEDVTVTFLAQKAKIFKLPFFRGFAGLIDSMRLSYKSLMLSADKAVESVEIDEEPSKFEKWLDEKFGDKLMKILMAFASVLGVALAIGLFFFLPSFLFDVSGSFIPAFRDDSVYSYTVTDNTTTVQFMDEAEKELTVPFAVTDTGKVWTVLDEKDENGLYKITVTDETNPAGNGTVSMRNTRNWKRVYIKTAENGAALSAKQKMDVSQEGLQRLWKSIFEGVLKIVLFLGYIILVSQTKDMKRVFMYHGAEHKTIFCYENDEELTVANVKKQIRFHPRCGTSFMVIMLLLGILIGLFVPANPFGIAFLRPLFKILLIPVTCGIGYELIKLCGRHDNTLTRIIAAPGLWAQRITTKEPDDDMIEVAITAIKAVIPDDGSDIINCGC